MLHFSSFVFHFLCIEELTFSFITMPAIKDGDSLHPTLWEIASSHHPLLKFAVNKTSWSGDYQTTVTPLAKNWQEIIVIPPTEISSKKDDLQVEELLANISISSTVRFLDNVTDGLLANATKEASSIIKTIKVITMPDVNHGEDIVKIQQTWWEWFWEHFEKIVYVFFLLRIWMITKMKYRITYTHLRIGGLLIIFVTSIACLLDKNIHNVHLEIVYLGPGNVHCGM